MAPKPPSSDDQNPASADDPELAKKLALEAAPLAGCRRQGDRYTADDEDDEDDDELELTTTMMTRISSSSPPRKPPARWRRSTASSSRISDNYRKLLIFVGFGVLVETLFNVIMPLSLKFLIDDALGEEDFQALYKILGVLAVAGIVTSIVAVWYERWDARLAAGIIADVRAQSVRARPETAGVVFCPHQARRNSLALLDRPLGLRRLGQDLRQQRGAAVPGIDRRHHPDAVPELAARGGGAAGVSDHADRAADPDAEGGTGQLRAEAE